VIVTWRISLRIALLVLATVLVELTFLSSADFFGVA
jgi:hypothetical protein